MHYLQRSCVWTQQLIDEENGRFHNQQKRGDELVFGFQLKEVPQFANRKEQPDFEAFNHRIDAFVSQLMEGYFHETSDDTFLKTIEYRIQSQANSGIVDFYILLRLVGPYQLDRDTADDTLLLLQQILPSDYGFQELLSDELKAILSAEEKYHGEVVRQSRLLPLGSVGLGAQRMLAPPLMKVENVNMPYLLPCVDYLKPEGIAWVDLFDSVQQAGGGMVRISVQDQSVSIVEKHVATNYISLLKTAKTLDEEIIKSYNRGFRKYITGQKIFSVKLQSAASRRSTAKSLALSLITTFSPKGRADEAFTYLKSQSNDTSVSDWSQMNHSLSDLQHEQFTGENRAFAFLQRISALYDAAEVRHFLRLPYGDRRSLPGMPTAPLKPFYTPSVQTSDHNHLILGQILRGRASLPVGINVNDLTKHALIVGSTGSGKTNTTLNLVRGLMEKGIPFLIIEPVKTEYYDQLKALFPDQHINRFNFDKPINEDGSLNRSFFRFNPFIPVKGISVSQHIAYIKNCFSSAFPMYGITPQLLEMGIRRLYADVLALDPDAFYHPEASPEYGQDMSDRVIQPTDYLELGELILTLKEMFEDKTLFPDSDDSQELVSYLLRRIELLRESTLNYSFTTETWAEGEQLVSVPDQMMQLLTTPTILELDHLPDNEDKSLVMAFVLTYLFEYGQTKPTVKSLEHFTIIEEAHRLLSSSSFGGSGAKDGEGMSMGSQSRSISLFIDMLAEIRSKGEGIGIVEQIPTKLIPDAIKNTNLKIGHRLTARDDREYLGQAMNMTPEQMKYINILKTGEAIVFEEQLQDPILIKVDRYDQEKEAKHTGTEQ